MTYLHVIIAYLTDDIKWTSNKTYLTQNASSTHGVDLFGDVKKLHCGGLKFGFLPKEKVILHLKKIPTKHYDNRTIFGISVNPTELLVEWNEVMT
jgi:hypothetical protein